MSKKIAEWWQELQELSLQENPPVRQANENWRIADRRYAWEAAGPRIFDEHLERFKAVAITVLGEKDPKFDLPQEDRIYAAVKGKKREYSSALRKGIAETLALLGSQPQPLTSCSDGKPGLIACLVVRELLGSADPVLWASLNDVLPLLSEADPREFLENCESALSSDSKPFEFLFGEEQGGVFGTTYMSGLLWALENLAWSSDYLSRVALVLASLASIDPGGNWSNRPSNSLFTIFCPWLPQTSSTVEKRVAAVKALESDFPRVGWKLLLELLPSSHQSSTGTHKPTWRKLIPEDWPEKPTNKEYWGQVTAYSNLAVTLAKDDLAKLPDLISRLPNFPEPAHSSILEHLSSEEITKLSDDQRTRIWNSLQELITQHRKFANADWAMSLPAIEDLEKKAQSLTPQSPVHEYKRLFTANDFELMSDKGDYEAQCQELEVRRQVALKAIHSFGGTDEVFGMIDIVESPHSLGLTLGRTPELIEDSKLLPAFLIEEDEDKISFTDGFVRGRFGLKGWKWVDSFALDGWPPNAIARFYTDLPFCKNSWDRVEKNLADDASAYWQNVGTNIYEAGEDAVLGIELLIQNDRAHSAVRELYSLQHQTKKSYPGLAFSALEAALKTHENLGRLHAHSTVQVITSLQKLEGVDLEKLSNIEWNFLPLLGRHSRGSPYTLEQKLAREPEFFCQVIQMVFRASGEDPPKEEPTEKARSMAENAYRLLDDWRIPPGVLPDGSFNGDNLVAWVKKVKDIANASGHIDIALQKLGQVLFHSQDYASDLWLPNEVANVLNQSDGEQIRRGLITECFNSRGTHGFTHGNEEHEIAAGYRNKAEAFELAGYTKLADSLRGLAESYERDAEREAKRDPFED